MDYSNYKQLLFKRKFIAIPPKVRIVDPTTNQLVGYTKMKLWSLKGDIRFYTDESMQQETFRIGGRQMVSLKRIYNIYDSSTNAQLFSIRQNSMRSVFVRDHMDIYNAREELCGAVQETSGPLALIRRWIELIPTIGPWIGLALLFVPQKFDIIYQASNSEGQIIGKVVHTKTPVLVRMSLDTSMAQVTIDPRLGVSAVALLCILDAAKNR